MKLFITLMLASLFVFSTSSFARSVHNVKNVKNVDNVKNVKNVDNVDNVKNINDNSQHNMNKAIKFLRLAKSTVVGKGKLAHLLKARKALVDAAPNKGGHRAAAIALINKALKVAKKNNAKANGLIEKAINQTKKGKVFANKHSKNKYEQHSMTKAVKFLKLAKSTVVGKGKLAHLMTARRALVSAKPNKGGNRVAAIALIDKSLKVLKNQKNNQKANKIIQKAINRTKAGIKHAK